MQIQTSLCLPSFTIQTLHKWSILLMSDSLSLIYDQSCTMWLPLSWHHIPQSQLQSPYHQFGSLPSGPFSLVSAAPSSSLPSFHILLTYFRNACDVILCLMKEEKKETKCVFIFHKADPQIEHCCGLSVYKLYQVFCCCCFFVVVFGPCLCM